MQLFSIVGLGFLLGIRHATDADHVVAVSTIVAREKKLHSAGLVGIIWGIGHTITIMVVGAAIILFHVVIPPRLGLFFEFLVAVALISLGVLNLTGLLGKCMSFLSQPGFMHAHLHFHGHEPHVHVHKHGMIEPVSEPKTKRALIRFIEKFGVFQLLRPLVVGLVHGLAGSAAIALLILGTITDSTLALFYLFIFGIGTVIGMMVITTLIGLPIIASSKKFARVDHYISQSAGLLSLGFGLYLAYQIGIVQGLFGQHPVWDAH